MNWTLIFPLISALLASTLTYYWSLKIKQTEYLQQNRIASFKAIATEIIQLKKYCLGREAFYKGREFSPFQEIEGSGLFFREKIADSITLNGIFLTAKSQELLEELDGTISLLCNAELLMAGNSLVGDSSGDENAMLPETTIYSAIVDATNTCLDGLYRELGLPK